MALLGISSLSGALFATVEVEVKAWGILRAPSGLRSVESVLAGAVSEVFAQSGDAVEMGQVLLRLEDAELRAEFAVREQELATLRHETEESSRVDRALLDEVLRAGDRQEAALARRNHINQAQIEQRSARLSDLRSLVAYGAASQKEAWDADESVQAALQQGALLDSQLIDLDLAMADRLREWEARELGRRSTLNRAQAAVEDARSALQAMEIRSPVTGRVESLLPKPGDPVQAGARVAEVVPGNRARRIVSFVPSREATEVGVESTANVEVESLPMNEFGMAQARVERVASDVARADEMLVVLGHVLPGSHVRVELELSADAAHQPIAPYLRSGERVRVHLHTRERRIWNVLLEFARSGLEH